MLVLVAEATRGGDGCFGTKVRVCAFVCYERTDRTNERTFRREKELKVCVSVCPRVCACASGNVQKEECVLRKDKQTNNY